MFACMNRRPQSDRRDMEDVDLLRVAGALLLRGRRDLSYVGLCLAGEERGDAFHEDRKNSLGRPAVFRISAAELVQIPAFCLHLLDDASIVAPSIAKVEEAVDCRAHPDDQA